MKRLLLGQLLLAWTLAHGGSPADLVPAGEMGRLDPGNCAEITASLAGQLDSMGVAEYQAP